MMRDSAARSYAEGLRPWNEAKKKIDQSHFTEFVHMREVWWCSLDDGIDTTACFMPDAPHCGASDIDPAGPGTANPATHR